MMTVIQAPQLLADQRQADFRFDKKVVVIPCKEHTGERAKRRFAGVNGPDRRWAAGHHGDHETQHHPANRIVSQNLHHHGSNLS